MTHSSVTPPGGLIVPPPATPPSLKPSVLILSEVRTRANSVALKVTVPSELRGMFMATRRWGRGWGGAQDEKGGGGKHPVTPPPPPPPPWHLAGDAVRAQLPKAQRGLDAAQQRHHVQVFDAAPEGTGDSTGTVTGGGEGGDGGEGEAVMVTGGDGGEGEAVMVGMGRW